MDYIVVRAIVVRVAILGSVEEYLEAGMLSEVRIGLQALNRWQGETSFQLGFLHVVTGHVLDQFPRGLRMFCAGVGTPGIGVDEVGALASVRIFGQWSNIVLDIGVGGRQEGDEPTTFECHSPTLLAEGFNGPAGAYRAGQDRGASLLEAGKELQRLQARVAVESRLRAIAIEHRSACREQERTPARRVGG